MEKDNDNGITYKLINEILENVCLLNNIEEPEVPAQNADASVVTKYNEELKVYQHQINIITYYIKAICNNILIETNRRKFVPELKYVVINLVNDQLISDKSIDEFQSIQSMSEAGRSVNFGVSNELAQKLNLLAQKQLNENELLISKYRLLYKS